MTVRSAIRFILVLLSRMRLWQKLAVLALSMAVPVFLLGCFYFSETTSGLRQANEELAGSRYLKALSAVYGEMLTHRGRAYAYLSGDRMRRADVVSQESSVDAQITAVDAIDSEWGEHFGSSAEWQSVKLEWAALRANTLQQAAEENEAAHALLTQHIDKLSRDIGAASMTSFDPDPATHALADIAIGLAPALRLASVEMRRYAVRAASKAYIGGDDRTGIRVFRERQLALTKSLESRMLQVPATATQTLRSAVSSAKTVSDAFYSLVQSRILTTPTLDITGGQVYDAGVPTNRAWKAVAIASYDDFTGSLRVRATQLSRARALAATITASALAFALLLAWFIHRAISRPLTHVMEVFAAISAGNYANPIEARGVDEANQVLGALGIMQKKLHAQIETERAVAAESARIRHALDKASSGVVLADAEHRIIYLNDTAAALFAQSRDEIRRSLPGFEMQALRGSPLEALSPEPAAERTALATLSGSRVQERQLGSLTFRTISNPVLDAQGARIGTVMEWTERTQEVAVERQMQGLLAAALQGDLSNRIELAGKSGFFAAASRGINQLADNLATIVAKVKDAAGEIYRGSREIAAGNQNLQARTEEQAGSLEQTAASMKEMMGTVKQNADNAGRANQLAMAAREQAERGGNEVGKAVGAMSGINDSAARIADIIGVIDEIAFQTNLLALNAAVEAARAGEQGRGFAVVATEVRTLAGRSATAAKEIKELIQDSVRKVSDGSVLVTQSGRTLEQIVTSVKKVSDIVAEIAAASREQSAGISQVDRAVEQMDGLTQQNSALVAQATVASLAMAREAQALHEMVGSFRLGNAAHMDAALASLPAQLPDKLSAAQPRAARHPLDKPERGNSPRADVLVSGHATAALAAGPALVAEDADGEWQEF